MFIYNKKNKPKSTNILSDTKELARNIEDFNNDYCRN